MEYIYIYIYRLLFLLHQTIMTFLLTILNLHFTIYFFLPWNKKWKGNCYYSAHSSDLISCNVDYSISKKKKFLVIISESLSLRKQMGKSQNCENVSCNYLFFFIMWQKQASIYPSIDYIKIKKCRVEIWFFPLVVDWMQAEIWVAVNFKKGEEF